MKVLESSFSRIQFTRPMDRRPSIAQNEVTPTAGDRVEFTGQKVDPPVSSEINATAAATLAVAPEISLTPGSSSGSSTAGFSVQSGLNSNASSASNPVVLMMEESSYAAPPRHLTHSQFNFDAGTEVVSSAQKFIIPVPQFEGEDLVYPQGAKGANGEDLSGKPMVDWEGNPIGGPGEKGLVFFNHKDQSWQAVKADGKGVVILNQVTQAQGERLSQRIGGDPSSLTLGEFKEVLEFAHGDLGIGDMYNSDRDFIRDKMDPMECCQSGVPEYGLHRRDDRDLCHAVLVLGSGTFQGPAASPQRFDDGAVLVRQPDRKAEGGYGYQLVQPDIFLETYKHKDGRGLTLGQIAQQDPQT